MTEMYNPIYIQELIDLGESPDCTTLAENIQEIQTLYQGGESTKPVTKEEKEQAAMDAQGDDDAEDPYAPAEEL